MRGEVQDLFSVIRILPLKIVIVLPRFDEVLEAHAQDAEHEKKRERHADDAGDEDGAEWVHRARITSERATAPMISGIVIG